VLGIEVNDAGFDTEGENAEQRGRGDEEFAAMQLPEPAQYLHLHETRDGHQHDGCEHGLRQIAQQVGEE
jgi:hypothetical protein